MPEQPTQEDIDKWHRRFAVECNNRAWDLASQAERTPEAEREMLNVAYASAFHWSKIGKPINDARADVTLAHVHALLGHGAQALKYAGRCLKFFESGGGEDWDLAFAHLEMALAAAVSGNAALHAKHYAEAKKRGAVIKDEGDRKAFEDELARLPREVRNSGH